MNLWMTWLAVLWPIAATITPVLIAVGLLWLRTKFADVKAMATVESGVVSIKERLGLIELRLDEVEDDLEGEPTRLQVLQKISEVSERLARVEESGHSLQRQLGQQIESIARQLKTQGDYVHTLIERGGK